MINSVRAIWQWVRAIFRRGRHGPGARGSVELRGTRPGHRSGKRRKPPC